MDITIIYDNTLQNKNLKSDWGFSALVEGYDTTILFDTGASGEILTHNMEKLNIDSQDIDKVFISHNHFDHTGGLSSFLDQNNDVEVYVPPSLRGIRNVKKQVYIKNSQKLNSHIFTTGTLQNIEQSLLIKTEKGIVVVVGCSHSGIGNILEVAKKYGDPYALIGGYHGFDQFELLKDLEIVCPTHCTEYIDKIKNTYPDKYIEGGAGTRISI